MISKSSFVKHYKCSRMLWCYFHDVVGEMSEMSKFNIENGHKVGELAKKYFDNTLDCSVTKETGEPIYDKQIEKTNEGLRNGVDSLAEASFRYDDLFCAVDILKKDDDGYSIYEVKSVGEIKPYHKVDIAFQKYVLEKCGINVKHIYLMHYNKDYVFNTKLNIYDYFKIELMDEDSVVADILDEINNNEGLVKRISDIKAICDKNSIEPQNTYCEYCDNCEYNSHCFKDLQIDNILELYYYGYKTAAPILNKGISSINDFLATDEYKADCEKREKEIEKDRKQALKGKIENKLTNIAKRQIQIDILNSKIENPYIDKDKLKTFIKNIKYPIYHLDFETTKLIIPEFDGFTPNEDYPYQYSLHIEYEDGQVDHKEYLGDKPNCARELVESLIKDIPLDSTIIVYNKGKEGSNLRDLADKYLDLKDHLLNLNDHIVDLYEVFRNYLYYNYDQHGSNSIKQVMPALCPEHKDAYKNLPNIQHGDDALIAYWKMLELKGTPEYDIMRNGMLKYCELDTQSMIWVLNALKELIVK